MNQLIVDSRSRRGNGLDGEPTILRIQGFHSFMAFGAVLTDGLTATVYHIFISVLLLTVRASTSHRFLDMQTGVAAVAKNSENGQI